MNIRGQLLVTLKDDAGQTFYLRGYDRSLHGSDLLWTSNRDEARVFKNRALAQAAADKYGAELEDL